MAREIKITIQEYSNQLIDGKRTIDLVWRPDITPLEETETATFSWEFSSNGATLEVINNTGTGRCVATSRTGDNSFLVTATLTVNIVETGETYIASKYYSYGSLPTYSFGAVTGQPIYASDWNNFLKWLDAEDGSLTREVSKGDPITATLYNNAAARAEIVTGKTIPRVVAGQAITAALFNALGGL